MASLLTVVLYSGAKLTYPDVETVDEGDRLQIVETGGRTLASLHRDEVAYCYRAIVTDLLTVVLTSGERLTFPQVEITDDVANGILIVDRGGKTLAVLRRAQIVSWHVADGAAPSRALESA